MIGDVVVGSDEVAVGSGDAYDLYMATVQFVDLGSLVLPVPGDTTAPYRPERPANATDVAVMHAARVSVLNAHARLCKVIVRHIAGASSGRADVGISPVDTLPATPGGVFNTNGSRTVGCSFILLPGDPIAIRGVRFYWVGTGINVTAKLWIVGGSGVALASQTVAVAGTGVREAIFASPVDGIYGVEYIVSAYSGANYPHVTRTSVAALPQAPILGHRMVWTEFNSFANGDALPGSRDAQNAFMCEPIF